MHCCGPKPACEPVCTQTQTQPKAIPTHWVFFQLDWDREPRIWVGLGGSQDFLGWLSSIRTFGLGWVRKIDPTQNLAFREFDSRPSPPPAYWLYLDTTEKLAGLGSLCYFMPCLTLAYRDFRCLFHGLPNAINSLRKIFDSSTTPGNAHSSETPIFLLTRLLPSSECFSLIASSRKRWKVLTLFICTH